MLAIGRFRNRETERRLSQHFQALLTHASVRLLDCVGSRALAQYAVMTLGNVPGDARWFVVANRHLRRLNRDRTILIAT